ncbi:glycosyltransferase family A protein [Campylobacter sp.]|uniref:glycosyltransferase family 2 protein n=1 Tax=Campylobacter sp. TaxID=205 RepID=UPI00259D1B3B|nr:glycosyltransferase family A protein [Campylobacter sp.]MBQ8819730.1 glycosyltransferase family 2 protein [Campylobacter sp.]
MHNKSVGIVVPIYNAAKYLEKCLHSISIQTYKNIKILLIDYVSTDKNVYKIIKSYIYKDSRFTSIKISNSGQGVARNIGIEHFINTDKTDCILFVDSDDYIDKNCIEELIKNIDDADFIWFDFRYKFENTKPHSNQTSIENYNLQNKITISNKDWLELSA